MCSAHVAERSIGVTARAEADSWAGPASLSAFGDIALGGSQAPSEAHWAASALSPGLGTAWEAWRLTSPLSACSVSNKELSELIEQLQKNADQVERNIVDTEAKMQSVSACLPPGTPEMLAPWGSGARLTPRVSAGHDSAPGGCVVTPGDIFSHRTLGSVGSGI